MKLTRRALTTGLATLATLAPFQGLAQERRLIAYRPAGEPIHFSFAQVPYLATHAVLAASDWHYQPVNPTPDDSRGIVRHLSSGLTFLTVLDPSQEGVLVDLHMSYCLLADGETPVIRDVAYEAIARGAALVAFMNECVTKDAFYIPPERLDADAVEEPPFIVGEIQGGFLLNL